MKCAFPSVTVIQGTRSRSPLKLKDSLNSLEVSYSFASDSGFSRTVLVMPNLRGGAVQGTPEAEVRGSVQEWVRYSA